MLKGILATLVSIVLLFVLTKLMGNKQIAQMNLFDYVVGITIGSIAAEMATNLDGDTFGCAVAMVIFALTAFGISVATNKSLRLRAFFAGRPIVLMRNGKLYRGGLKAAHLDLSEFLAVARLAGYYDLSEVSGAIFEHNGSISFLPFAQHRPYTPADANIGVKPQEILYDVILDGRIMDDALHRAGKDREWLKKHMRAEGYKDEREILLALAGTDDTVTFFGNEA
ncbi:MAG: DUF421 domain-containing protein [Hominenteromicrobium sp.]